MMTTTPGLIATLILVTATRIAGPSFVHAQSPARAVDLSGGGTLDRDPSDNPEQVAASIRADPGQAAGESFALRDGSNAGRLGRRVERQSSTESPRGETLPLRACEIK